MGRGEKPKRKPPMRHTKEECAAAAKLYQKRTDFRRAEPILCDYARQHNFLNEICSHMGDHRKSPFTFEKCVEIARQCKSRKEFYTKYRTAYQRASEANWLKKIFEIVQLPKQTNLNRHR